MERTTIFISDLHLNQTTPETMQLLLEFAEKITTQLDAVYILGDLFRFWAGDDDSSLFNTHVKTILKKISNKVPVYLMPGNRDFLLGQTFAAESGCTLINDPCKIDLYGRISLLTHGDILCTNDIKYRVFRRMIRISPGIKLFLKLPLTIRLRLASCMQKYSSKTRNLKNKTVISTQPSTIKQLLADFNAEQIIHGHIHKEETDEIIMNNQKARRISLGEWDTESSILFYDNNHNIEFKKFW